MKQPCPECVDGVITETLRYTQPPPGDAIWPVGKKAAWPVVAENGQTVEVTSRRKCCRCGGDGEYVTSKAAA